MSTLISRLASRLRSTAAGYGAALVGFLQSATGAIARTVHDRLLDTPSIFDWMTPAQIADVRASTKLIDVTAAIQAAIDWAYANNKALRAHGGGYLCGQVTTYPTTTIIGDGRHVTNFWCAAGTVGKWWSDRGNGAQKLTLSGMAFYGNDEAGLTHVAEFGDTGTVYGTEGNLKCLWFRDAPNAHGLLLNGNVGLFSDITVQGVATGIEVKGAYNMGRDLIVVDSSVTGLILTSGFYHNIEIEAPASGSLPLSMFRPGCHVYGLTLALADATSFTRLVELDASMGDEWTVSGMQKVVGAGATYTSVFKFNATTWDGQDGFNAGQAYTRTLTTETETVKAGLTIGTQAAAAPILSVLKLVAACDFPSVAAGGKQELSFALVGAVAGMMVAIGSPAAGTTDGLVISARVSATDVLTVRAFNPTAAPIDPPTQTYGFTVFNYA